MTRAERAVAVAQDVLKQIKARKIKASPGTYVHVKMKSGVNLAVGDDVQTQVLPNAKSCEVCAIGAAFTSYVRLFDKVKVAGGYNPERDEDWTPPEISMTGDYRRSDRTGLVKELRGVFSAAQLELIETAFEKCNVRWGALGERSTTRRAELAAIAFGKRAGVPSARLAAIARNIIKNGGKFVPPDISDAAWQRWKERN